MSPVSPVSKKNGKTATPVDVDQFLELKQDQVLAGAKGRRRKAVKPAVEDRAERMVVSSDLADDQAAILDRYVEQTKGLEQDRLERQKYAQNLFDLLKFWMIFFGAVIALRGMSEGLSDQVMIAVVTATTLKVIGLFWLVTRYLFPARDSNKG